MDKTTRELIVSVGLLHRRVAGLESKVERIINDLAEIALDVRDLCESVFLNDE